MNFPFSRPPKSDALRDDFPAPSDAALVEPPSLPIISEASLPPALRDDLHFFRTLCTRLWRFERQLVKVAQTEPSESHDRLTRRFESIIEALRDAKIEIIDHDGEKYDSGLNLSVLQFEPREELSREMVIETVKPSLIVRGIRIPGEVIVGQPIVVEAEPVADNAEPIAEIEEISSNVEADSTTVEEAPSVEMDPTKNEGNSTVIEADSTKNEEVALDTEENR